jgi:hypothetical protein
MLKTWTIPIAFCVAASVVALPSVAKACGGSGLVPTPVALKAVTVVFLGTVEKVTERRPQGLVATFLITKAYRGAGQRRINVTGYCDAAFSQGVAYLVYAEEYGGELMTTPHHRTRPQSAATEDVRYLDNQLAGRPQAVVFGEVYRRITGPDGSPARQTPFETLNVVAVGSQERRSVFTDRWGPYQIVLIPGEYEFWVERGGRRVTRPQRLRVASGDERQLSFTATY